MPCLQAFNCTEILLSAPIIRKAARSAVAALPARGVWETEISRFINQLFSTLQMALDSLLAVQAGISMLSYPAPL
jgi:hypothetical protein